MAIKDLLQVSKGTKRVLGAVLIITIGIVVSSWVYYRGINRSVDPRIVSANLKYDEFRKLVKSNSLDHALVILDEIEAVYLQTSGYESSFELGVVNNDRGSVFLNKVETEYLTAGDKVIKENVDQYLVYAKGFFETSVAIYEAWLARMGKLNRREIEAEIKPYFPENDPAFSGYQHNRIVEKRVEDILEAQIETERRLSVTLTNLGVIARYNKDNLQSKAYYEQALALWPENYVANDNLRVLHGQPVEKRSIINQLFPKDRIEKAKENMKK